MAYDSLQIDFIRSRLLCYRALKGVNGRPLPWKTLHERLALRPNSGFEIKADGTMVPDEETLRRFALRRHSLQSMQQVNGIVALLIDTKMLSAAAIERQKFENIISKFEHIISSASKSAENLSKNLCDKLVGVWNARLNFKIGPSSSTPYFSAIEIYKGGTYVGDALYVTEALSTTLRPSDGPPLYSIRAERASVGIVLGSVQGGFSIMVIGQFDNYVKFYLPVTAIHDGCFLAVTNIDYSKDEGHKMKISPKDAEFKYVPFIEKSTNIVKNLVFFEYIGE